MNHNYINNFVVLNRDGDGDEGKWKNCANLDHSFFDGLEVFMKQQKNWGTVIEGEIAYPTHWVGSSFYSSISSFYHISDK